jgi:hypothetical protein
MRTAPNPRRFIFPDRTSITRLVGAVQAEQHDEWAEGRRHLGIGALARSGTTTVPDAQEATTQVRRFDYGLEVSTPRAKRVLLGVAIGEAAAAVVIPNDREPLAERVQPMAPERARPVEVKMRKPGPDPHQRRTTAVSRPRDTSPVGRRRKGRLHPHHASVAASSALCVSARRDVRLSRVRLCGRARFLRVVTC